MDLAAIPKAISPARLGELVMGTERQNGRDVPKYKRTRFVNFLNRELLALAAGDFDKLAVFAPPRHGKTLILNELYAAWFLGNFPHKKVIVASHSATLASNFGMHVRDILEEFGGGKVYGTTVRQDRRAVDNWATTEGGGMLSIGVGGSLVGHGADLFIFDDIIADAAAALSETVRRSTLDWYESTAETRVNAGGQQIFTMQRWHGEDPAQKVVFDHARNWRIVNLPAIAEEGDMLGRTPGEALWPEKWPIAYLRELESRKAFWFAAQYQQRPVPRGGGMFKREWFRGKILAAVPGPADSRVRWWDKAASQGKGDYTAGPRLCSIGPKVYVEAMRRGQWDSGSRDAIIRATCEDDNRQFPGKVATWGEQEPGSAGKDSAIAFGRMLAPYLARTETSSGSKEVRADAFAAACERGDVYIVLGDWNADFLDELCAFPNGKHDDQVDACSGAFNKLTLGRVAFGPSICTQAEYERAQGGFAA